MKSIRETPGGHAHFRLFRPTHARAQHTPARLPSITCSRLCSSFPAAKFLQQLSITMTCMKTVQRLRPEHVQHVRGEENCSII